MEVLSETDTEHLCQLSGISISLSASCMELTSVGHKVQFPYRGKHIGHVIDEHVNSVEWISYPSITMPPSKKYDDY